MEVQHPQHVTKKKKWTEYLLEFFMLFLAVFLGSIAENYREHYVESEREKVYIRNLYEDLKSDTAIYRHFLTDNHDFSSQVDTLIKRMKAPERDSNLKEIYYLARILTTREAAVIPEQRTFSQLKNSGQLRLISNHDVISGISNYYLDIDQILNQNNFIFTLLAEYFQEAGNLFDAETMYYIRMKEKVPDSGKLRLLTNDEVMINKFLSSAQYLYGGRKLQEKFVKVRLEEANELLALIKHVYKTEVE